MKSMLRFWTKPRQLAPERPRLPKGHRIYAIGDVHGRLDLLEQLLATIENDNASRPHARTTLVFLGDLIDRGPSSRQVIERLSMYRHPSIDTFFISGNHEEVALKVIDGDTTLFRDWMRFGGAEFVKSYGLDPAALLALPLRKAVSQLSNAIPAAHVAFLRSMNDSLVAGDYLFVHAGIRPGIALDRQTIKDLRWIRGSFLKYEGRHSHFVVHGHTISEAPDLRPGRLGIDTGAYLTGVLTALRIEGDGRWIMQTGQSG